MSPFVDALLGHVEAVWAQATKIWVDGGWCMPPIAMTALVMFGLGIHVHLKLRDTGTASVPERTWRTWIANPSARKGPIGFLLDTVTGRGSLHDITVAFQEVRARELSHFQRDLRVIRVCIGAAPLFGLLGTVTGMLATFDAMASGSGGEKTMALVASGISEALITTETGLVIALPGVFMQYGLSRRFDRYKAFLAHLETVCTQSFYWASKARARQAKPAGKAARTSIGTQS